MVQRPLFVLTADSMTRLTVKRRIAATALALLLSASTVTAADRAIKTALVYDGGAFDDLAGGLRRGSTYLGTLRLQLTFERHGFSMFVEGLNIHGGQPSDFAGDAQGVSNLAGPSGSRIEEAWIQQTLFDDRVSVLFGRYDLSTEFYRSQSGGLFLNSSFGTGPELSQNGPSVYPDTSTGARITYRPVRSVLLRFARFKDLSIGEAAYLYRPTPGNEPRNRRLRIGRLAGLAPYQSKVAVGAWHFTSDGSAGVYVVADQTIYTDPGEGTRHIGVFGQLGFDRARGDRFARYTGIGLAMSAPIRGRDNDEVGVAVASGRDHASFTMQTGIPAAKGETTLECTYLAPITSRLAIQPDLQYVIHPDSRRTTKNALVVLLQFEISF
jgi:porin